VRYLAIAALVVLAACGGEDEDPWTYGDVIEREFNPAHDVHHPAKWVDGGQDCGYRYEYDWFDDEYENVYRCIDRPDVWQPAWTQHIPDQWRIRIGEDSDGADGTIENHWISVTEMTYEDCRVGDRYMRLEQACPAR